MIRQNARSVALFFALSLFGAFLDLLTKGLTFASLEIGQEVAVIPGYFDFGCVLNSGSIFSLGADRPALWIFLSVLAVPVVIAIFLFSRPRSGIFTICFGMILAGTLGNAYDRITEGAVRDFIKFYVVNPDGSQSVWPLFNLADSFICVAVFLLFVESVLPDPPGKPSPLLSTS